MTDEKTKVITIPAILTRISYLKDGGLSLGFATNELTSEEKVAVSAFYHAFGWLAFKQNAVDLSDLPKEDAPEKGMKSAFERLRSTLFVWYTKTGGKEEEFETFRKKWVEKKIQEIKDNIPQDD